MKKTFSLFLLLLFLFNLGGVYLVTCICESENRDDIRASIKERKNEKFLELKVPIGLTEKENTQFIQTDEDEISYQGKIYDVVSSRKGEDGFIYYSCINDNTEENLKAIQEQLVLDNSAALLIKTTGSKHQKQILKNLIKDYLPICSANKIQMIFFRTSFRTDHAFSGLACFSKVPSPPPQLS